MGTNVKHIKSILSVKEVAEYISFCPNTIYSLIKWKKIPASRIGKQYIFVKTEIDKWIISKRVK